MPFKSVQIGNVTIDTPVFLAPMAGITDRTFRLLCRAYGCGLTYSEMVSAKSVVYDNARTRQLLDTDPQERPWAVQFFGHEPDVVAEAIRRLENDPFDIVDINMGCPVAKIVNNGEGSALMNDPLLVGRLVSAAARASSRPVTVKIRKGFSQQRANAAEIAHIAQESGAAAVAVHGRTRDQYYAGAADWNCIAEVKRSVTIPVIGNGDIFTPENAAQMLSETGCDAVMIARGAMGNPWLFSQTRTFLDNGEYPPLPDWETRIETALAHTRQVIAHKGAHTGLLEMRKQLSWYMRGCPSASALRRQIHTVGSYAEVEDILKNALL